MQSSTAPTTPAKAQCPYNALGKIAASYDELHNIAGLRAARESGQIPRATRDSCVQTMLQVAELALLNLAQLTARASRSVACDDVARALVYLRWVSGFHSILRRVGNAASDMQLWFPPEPRAEVKTLRESPALKGFLDSLRGFEREVNDFLERKGRSEVERVIGHATHDNADYELLHTVRLNSHDAVKWEADLMELQVTPSVPAYEEAVAVAALHRASKDARLSGDTFYGEFVALHQIPEVLCDEANDHVERAIQRLRYEALSEAVEHLAVARSLLTPVVESQRVMVECLATAEYHAFRENLGPASGIHSMVIRQHMFRDLFTCLWKELDARLARRAGSSTEAAQQISAQRHADAKTWIEQALVNQAMALHHQHDEWRHEHLHMPRNCLGSGGTKSMIGVQDGLLTVERMRQAANSLPSLRRVHEGRRVPLAASRGGLIEAHHAAEASLDSWLRQITGEVARTTFPEVQARRFIPYRSPHPERRP